MGPMSLRLTEGSISSLLEVMLISELLIVHHLYLNIFIVVAFLDV